MKSKVSIPKGLTRSSLSIIQANVNAVAIEAGKQGRLSPIQAVRLVALSILEGYLEFSSVSTIRVSKTSQYFFPIISNKDLRVLLLEDPRVRPHRTSSDLLYLDKIMVD